MEKVVHPCFESNSCGYRFHLPIAPRCNTKCNFCKRGISKEDDRPGVASGILDIKEIENYMEKNIACLLYTSPSPRD